MGPEWVVLEKVVPEKGVFRRTRGDVPVGSLAKIGQCGSTGILKLRPALQTRQVRRLVSTLSGGYGFEF